METNTQDIENAPDVSVITQFRMFLQAATTVVEAFKKRADEIAVIIQPAIAQLRANLELLPARTKELQRNLAARGWYLLPQMPFALAPLKRLCRGKNGYYRRSP